MIQIRDDSSGGAKLLLPSTDFFKVEEARLRFYAVSLHSTWMHFNLKMANCTFILHMTANFNDLYVVL